MSVKILLLTTGERIITSLQEVSDKETGKGICFQIKCPYILSLSPSPDKDKQYSVNFTKLIPYSSSNAFQIPYSSVVAIGEVEEELLEIYMQRFGDIIDDNNTLPTSDSIDPAEESGVPDSGD